MSASMVKPRSDGPFFKKPREFAPRGAGGFPIGPRTKARAEGNRELNKLPPWIKNNCELKIPGICVKNKMLTWAHPTKSRFIVTAKQWREAARACLPCHDYADHKISHAKMRRLVTEAIRRRKLHR